MGGGEREAGVKGEGGGREREGRGKRGGGGRGKGKGGQGRRNGGGGREGGREGGDGIDSLVSGENRAAYNTRQRELKNRELTPSRASKIPVRPRIIEYPWGS